MEQKRKSEYGIDKEVVKQLDDLKENHLDGVSTVDPDKLKGNCITAIMLDAGGHYVTVSAKIDDDQNIDDLPNRKNFLKIFRGDSVTTTIKQAERWIEEQKEAK